jgi:chromosome segregation ATPase
MDNALVKWIKENAINLVVTMFLIGGAYGSLGIQNSWRDASIAANKAEMDKSANRIEALEKMVAQLTFQRESDHGAILGLTSDSKQLQINGAKIEAQIDVVNTKLDNLIIQLSKISAKIDQGNSK